MKSGSFSPQKPSEKTFQLIKPGLEDAPAEITNLLHKILNLEGRLYRYQTNARLPMGYYKLCFPDKSSSVFIKIISKKETVRRIESDSLARHLVKYGLQVSLLLPSYTTDLKMENDFSILAYTYIEGRYGQYTKDDLIQVGITLADIHTAFSQITLEKSIQKATLKQFELLKSRQKKIIREKTSFSPHPEYLQKVLSEADSFFVFPNEPCQVLHGELHPGNLLFPIDGSQPVILDLEDSLFSWLPIRMDIAYTLERFILIRDTDDHQALKSSRIFLNAYLPKGGEIPFKQKGDLQRSLRWLSLRALCLLAEKEATGQKVPAQEWEKFFWLLSMSAGRSKLLLQIEDLCIQN